MSNLVPTPRTDKNGRTVIRHMKPEAGVSQQASTLPRPDPVVNPEIAVRDALKDEIFELIRNNMSDTLRGDDTRFKNTLRVINSTSQLEKALAVAKAIKESSANYRYSSYESDRFAEDVRRPRPITIAYANLDIIRNSKSLHGGYMTLIDVHQSIALNRYGYEGGPSDNPNVIERMDSHMHVYNALREELQWRSSEEYGEVYAPLVSKYPDHAEQLVSYLRERGYAQGFSDEGFEAYIAADASAIAEGIL